MDGSVTGAATQAANAARPAENTLIDWPALAACAGMSPAWWYSDDYADQDRALDVCSGCRVRSQCLEAGLAENHGIWGGMSARGRRKLRKRTSTETR